MPRGDKTGPMGEGAMTGRGEGFCAGNDQPGFISRSFGGGFGRGPGIGRGQGGGGRNRRRNFDGRFIGRTPRYYNQQVPTEEFVTSSQQEELNYLKEQAQSLKGTLENIEQQVSKMQKEIEKKNNTSENSEE